MQNTNIPLGMRLGLPTADKGGVDELVLFGRYATSALSSTIPVGRAPVVLKAYGLLEGETVTVLNVYAPTGLMTSYSYKGASIVLSAEESTAILPLTGNYALLFAGAALGSVLVTATTLSNDSARTDEAALRSQLAQPNLLLGPGISGPVSVKVQITNRPWVFRAYGLSSGTTIQVLNVTTTPAGEVTATYARDGAMTVLSETNTALVLDVSGVYRFELIGAQNSVLLVGNENPIAFIDPYIAQGPPGPQGLPGPQGPPGGDNNFVATAQTDLNYPAVVAVNNGLAHYADPTNAADMSSLLAITTQAATAGSSVVLSTAWLHAEPMWNWAPGRIYLGLTNGNLTQTPGSTGAIIEVGRAVSQTIIEFAIQLAILRN